MSIRASQRWSARFVIALAVAIFGSSVILCHAATFMGLGFLDDFAKQSYANAVSADGSTVVGFAHTLRGSEAFRWTTAAGMVGLGHLGNMNSNSGALAVSADGSVIVGSSDSAPGAQAFRWTDAGGMVGLGDLPGDFFQSYGADVSADGSVVVGFSQSANGREAMRWTSATGMVGLGDIVGGNFESTAFGTSPDGSIVVGYGTQPFSPQAEAFRWTSADGLVDLGDMAAPTFFSQAHAISADASVIVGEGIETNPMNGLKTTWAVRWTSDKGTVRLGDLPGGVAEGHALAVSSTGRFIVGDSISALGDEAFFWSVGNGMQNLRELLESAGATGVTGWTLTKATGISSNGRTIVGYGISPQGHEEAWIATIPIPEPDSLSLLALALLSIKRWKRCALLPLR